MTKPSASTCYNIANIKTFSLYPHHVEKLNAYAQKMKQPKSKLIQEWIESLPVPPPEDSTLIA